MSAKNPKKSDRSQIKLSIPAGLLAAIDAAARGDGGRAKFIQTAIREKLDRRPGA